MKAAWFAWGTFVVSQAVLFYAYWNLLQTVKTHTQILKQSNETFEHIIKAMNYMTSSVKKIGNAVSILNNQEPPFHDTDANM